MFSTCSKIHYNKILLKYVKYMAIVIFRKICKNANFSSSSSQTAYHETGVSNRSHENHLYWNVHDPWCTKFSKADKLQVCNITSVSFRCHFLVCSCRTRKVSFVQFSSMIVAVSSFFGYVAPLCSHGPVVVLSRQYSYKTGCRSHRQLLAILRWGMQVKLSTKVRFIRVATHSIKQKKRCH